MHHPYDVDAILGLMRKNPHISLLDVSNETGFSKNKVTAIVNELRDSGTLKRTGPRKGGTWVIAEPVNDGE